MAAIAAPAETRSATHSHFTQANQNFVKSFSHGDKAAPPARKLIVVTCMDARVHPEKLLGLEIGDAHVIRNAGGRTADALRSVVVSQQFLGTKEIAVIMHTSCGMETFENADVHKVVGEKLGPEAASEASQIDFLPFKGVEESVRADIRLLQNSRLLLPDTKYLGYVYDVHTGKLLPVS